MDSFSTKLNLIKQQAALVTSNELVRLQAAFDTVDLLCAHHPEKQREWKNLLSSVVDMVEKKIVQEGATAISVVVRNAEQTLSPVAPYAKQLTVHCVGHGHIDMNWMWGWPETVALTIDTLKSVLSLMEEFPAFRYSQSQASIYAIVEKYSPVMLKEIAARIKEGRWEVTASHWVEADKNIPDGESLCQHLFQTRRYLNKLLGLSPEDVIIDWSPDTFGHAATVPTYLARGGVKYLYLHRPGNLGIGFAPAYWWKGPDGSKVLVQNDMRNGYSGSISPEPLLAKIRDFVIKTNAQDILYVYGVGDHGGGPTRRDISMMETMKKWPIFPCLEFSTSRAFYDKLSLMEDKLPTIEGELNCEFTGCYTTQSLIKRSNRLAEIKLFNASFASVLSNAVMHNPYPSDAIDEAWRKTLFSQFHDILPGSGVHDTRTFAHGMFQEVAAATGMMETLSLRGVAEKINTRMLKNTVSDVPASFQGMGVGFGNWEGGIGSTLQSNVQGVWPFVIFNTLQWNREEIIEATIWNNDLPGRVEKPFGQRSFKVIMADGRELQAQVVDKGEYWGHEFVVVSFPVSVPAFGWSLYLISESEKVPNEIIGALQMGHTYHCDYARYERSLEGLQNEFLSVELDLTDGGIRTLIHKQSGEVLMKDTGPLLEYVIERSRGMTAWMVDSPFTGPEIIALSIKRKAQGPYTAALEVCYQFAETTMILTYCLKKNDPKLYLRVQGDWFQRGTEKDGIPVLNLALPLQVENAHATYEIAFGAIDRAFNRGEEVPAHRWALVNGTSKGRPAGVLLVNDCKYGHSLDGSMLRLSLLRASHDPDALPEVRKHDMRMALLPFTGSFSQEDAIRFGRTHNHPLTPVACGSHEGDLPGSGSMLAIEHPSAVVSMIKMTDNENEVIVRIYEPAGINTDLRLVFNSMVWGPVLTACETDIMERPLKDRTIAVAGDSVIVKLSPRTIVTLRVSVLLKKHCV